MLPHGPRPIGKNRQVGLPRAVVEALHLDAGDGVWFVLAEELPGCAVMLPAEVTSDIWMKGWKEYLRDLAEADGEGLSD